jgi:hypothetical protein
MLFVEPTPFWEHTGQIAQEYEGARAGNDDLSERLVGRVVEGLDGWLVEISAANKDTGEENGQEQNSDY